MSDHDQAVAMLTPCRFKAVIDAIPAHYLSPEENQKIHAILDGKEAPLTSEEIETFKKAGMNDRLAARQAVTSLLRGRGFYQGPAEQGLPPLCPQSPRKGSQHQKEQSKEMQKVHEEVVSARLMFAGDPEKFATVIINTCQDYLSDDDEADRVIGQILRREKLSDPRTPALRGRAAKTNRGRKPRVEKSQAKTPSSAKLFMPAILVNGILPQKDLGKEILWSQKDADRTITISSGIWNNPETGKKEPAGIPFGKVARLILLDIVSQAKTKKTRTIFAADTLHGMMNSLGMTWGGGAALRVREQVTRLFSSRITIDDAQSLDEDIVSELRISERRHLLWEPDTQTAEESLKKESFIRLSPEFYEEIISRSVPLDAVAARYLLLGNKTSGFDFDLYTILTKRCYRPHGQSGPPTATLKWDALAEQMGVVFSRPRDFRRRVGRALDRIWGEDCWPESRRFISITDSGVTISWVKGACTHVAQRQTN